MTGSGEGVTGSGEGVTSESDEEFQIGGDSSADEGGDDGKNSILCVVSTTFCMIMGNSAQPAELSQ